REEHGRCAGHADGRDRADARHRPRRRVLRAPALYREIPRRYAQARAGDAHPGGADRARTGRLNRGPPMPTRATIEAALKLIAPRIPKHEFGAVIDHALDSPG